jgi:hypothetical protein
MIFVHAKGVAESVRILFAQARRGRRLSAVTALRICGRLFRSECECGSNDHSESEVTKDAESLFHDVLLVK